MLGGGDDPVRPGIVHRLDRDTSGLMLVARTRGGPPRARGGDQGAGGQARVPGARQRPAAIALRHDRRAVGPRLPKARAACSLRTRCSGRPHALRDRLRGGAGHARPGSAGDRPHAPDPRALRRDRPSGGRRQPLRRRRAPWPQAPVPAQRAGSASATRRRARTSSSRPSCPTTSSWRSRSLRSHSRRLVHSWGNSPPIPWDQAKGPCPAASHATRQTGSPEHPRVTFNRSEGNNQVSEATPQTVGNPESRNCFRPACISATRRGAGTRACASSSTGSMTGSTSSTCCRPSTCWRRRAGSRQRSPVAAAPCCSSARRSRRRIRSRSGPTARACRT